MGRNLIAAAVKRPVLLSVILERMNEGINDVDISGNSPFMYAIKIRAFSALPLLIEAGVDHTHRSHRGETAWDIAVMTLKIEDMPPPEDRETCLNTIADWAAKFELAKGQLKSGSG
jgi:hypothetical protein